MSNREELWMLAIIAMIFKAGCGGGDGGIFGVTAGSVAAASTGMGGGSSSTGAEASGVGGSGQGGASTTAASSSSGQGGGPPVDIGCSDGTREYFSDVSAQPKIAGCSGGWSIAGVTTPQSMQPACNRVSGNSSANPSGMGCNVEDLCAEGWHVCNTATEVQQHSSTGQCDPFADPNAPQLWLTRQRQDGNGYCIAQTSPSTNNITGCGTAIGGPPVGGCDPLNRRMRDLDCVPDPVWYCGPPDMTGAFAEAATVTKDGPDRGGVLCCTN